MRLPDLNLILVLDALLRERNLTKAGQSIGMTQPAVSKALRRLRNFFGDELLIRVGHDYELTALARELAAPVAEVLHQLDAAIERRPSFSPSTDKRTFRIAASESSAYLVLRPFIERTTRDAPGISMQIRSLNGQTTVDQIRSGEIDLGIWRSELDPGMERAVIYRDRTMCAVWSGLEEVGDSLTLEEYERLPHLTYDYQRTEMAGLVKPSFDFYQRFDHTTITIEGAFLKLFMLKGTSSIALTPEKFTRTLQEVAALKLVPPPFEIAPFSESMYWHARSTTEPSHKWLRDAILEAGASL